MLGQRCAGGSDCAGGLICESNLCVAATCGNATLDSGETDVDCGGACAPCALGKACIVPADCESARCDGARCVTGPLTVLSSTPAKHGTLGNDAAVVVTFDQAVQRATVVPCTAAATPTGCNVILTDAATPANTLRLEPADIASLPAGFRFGHPRLAAGSTFTFTVLGGAAGPKTVHPATPVTLASDFSITFTTAPGIAP